MSLLPHPEIHQLRAAEGWLELGNAKEANSELDRLSPAYRVHPDVLHLRWQIQRKAQEWERCFELACSLTELSPQDPRGWAALAQSFYFFKRYAQAYDLAVAKLSKFPTCWPLYYDAACYASLTGRYTRAREFLDLALKFGDADRINQMAETDPDLDALRQEQAKV